MIFIGGISDQIKELFYGKKLYCAYCGRKETVTVLMYYLYFSFFFIPLFRWNRQFFVEFRDCGRRYRLRKEVGMRILRGEDTEITESDLTPLFDGQAGGNRSRGAFGEGAFGAEYANDAGVFAGLTQLPEAADTQKIKTKPGVSEAEAVQEERDRRYCPHCGEEIEMRFQYCPHCGGKL